MPPPKPPLDMPIPVLEIDMLLDMPLPKPPEDMPLDMPPVLVMPPEPPREPQSPQSVPRAHIEYWEPGPPSSQSLSNGVEHVFEQPPPTC